MRYRPIAILFLIVSMAALLACQKETPPPKEVIRAVKTIKVEERASAQTRKFSGVVEAVDKSSLSFEVAGNVKDVLFDVGQATYLAGYLAAGMTETGVVCTYGGINIPPVTIFMDGFAAGVGYHNDQKGTDVQVLGWNPDSREGLFTNNFESLDDGRAFAQNLYDEGADIVLPVAGPVGLGVAQGLPHPGEQVVGRDEIRRLAFDRQVGALVDVGRRRPWPRWAW